MSHKRQEFFKKTIEHKMRVLIFSTILLKHFSFYEEMLEM